MITINDIKDVGTLGQFIAWSFCACGVTLAVFWSYWAREFRRKFQVIPEDVKRRFEKLGFEVKQRIQWSEDLARKNPHAARIKLTKEEWQQRRREYLTLATKTKLRRWIHYGIYCAFCQAFWISLMLWLITNGQDWPSGICTAFAHACLISRFVIPRLGDDTKESTSKSCGRG